MGPGSDLPVMIAGSQTLDDFKIPYDLTIVSAHRPHTWYGGAFDTAPCSL